MKREILRHLEAIQQNAVDVIPQEDLLVKIENSLQKKQPLKLKIGFDPTACDIHLGHTVLLHKLRKLQDLGHIVYFIIGDFTAKIGDPSGRTALRPILSDEEIERNAATYTSQAFKILDQTKTKITYNSVWYKDMGIAKFLSLLSSYTVARILERDDFAQRMKDNRSLTLLEIIYPLIQGYDSVMIESDIEFGGTDQKFNLIVGRHLQEVFGQKPQAIVTMPLLVGLDGKNKMSKSLGNYVGVTESAKDMFGKIMSISDDVMWEYFRLLTAHNVDGVKTMHPKEAKEFLAETIVSFYHSQEAGTREREEFKRVFSQRDIPHDMPVYQASGLMVNILDILLEMKMIPSKREGRRLLEQSSISQIDSSDSLKTTAIVSENITMSGSAEIILKIGKKKFLAIVFSPHQ